MEFGDYPIYCLSFEGSERDVRMKQRFSQIGLVSEYQEPLSLSDPKLEYYLKDSHVKPEWRISSIVISFLEMFKKFVATGKDFGIFCQDDIYIRKTFQEDLSQIMSYIHKERIDFKVLLLGYLLPCHPRHYNCKELYKINNNFSLWDYPDDLWGSQMFLLSREGAIDLLEKYDKPFIENKDMIADDHTFTKERPRLMVYKLLACEEGQVNTSHLGQYNFHQNCKNFNYNPDEFY